MQTDAVKIRSWKTSEPLVLTLTLIFNFKWGKVEAAKFNR